METPFLAVESRSEDHVTKGKFASLSALFVVGFGTFLSLYVTQPLLPEFRRIFGASELIVSLTVSAPVLAVALTAPIVGLLADAMGRKRVIVTAMLGLAVFTGFAAFAASLSQLVVWRLLQGFFAGGIPATTIAYVSEETPRRSVGITMATYVTGTVVGGFAGRFITGLLSSLFDWRSSFAVLGIIILAGALLIWRLLPRSTRFVRQRNVIQALRPMAGHFHNMRLIATFAVGFNVLFCLVGAFTYVNFYLADTPFFLGPTALASIFAVYLVGAVITLPAGRVMDRIGQRKALMGAVGLSSIGMVLTLVHSVPVIVAGLALEASGVFACQSASSSHVGLVVCEARSSAAGLYTSFYYLGGLAGSILPGLLWDSAGWTGCVVIMLCMQTIAIVIARRWWQRRPTLP